MMKELFTQMRFYIPIVRRTQRCFPCNWNWKTFGAGFDSDMTEVRVGVGLKDETGWQKLLFGATGRPPLFEMMESVAHRIRWPGICLTRQMTYHDANGE